MKHNERFAVAHFLSEYPKEATFQEILEMVENQSPKVVIWRPFDSHTLFGVCTMIEDMAEEIGEAFYPMADAAFIIDRDSVKEMLASELGREPSINELDKVCEFVEHDFSYQTAGKVSDAVTYLELKIEGDK